VVDLQQLDGRSPYLDEGDHDAAAGAVGLDDDLLADESSFEVVDLEGDMGDSPYELRERSVVPVPLPLNTRTDCPGDR
jgi:hypothetical protein